MLGLWFTRVNVGAIYNFLPSSVSLAHRRRSKLVGRKFAECQAVASGPVSASLARFNLVIDVLDRVPRLQGRAAHLREDTPGDARGGSPPTEPSYAGPRILSR
jgi:hypothetical protein